MKSIFVCQIYDTLSEKVIHTFMASNEGHARDQFRRFLDSVQKYSDPKNFFLLYNDTVTIIESQYDYEQFVLRHRDDVEGCEKVGFVDEESEDESES